MVKPIYRGFTTTFLADDPRKSFKISDMDVVNRDILNHIYTMKGERLMHPHFGTRIPMLAFEPLDNKTLKIIEDDLREVVNFDPRVELIDISLTPIPNSNAIVVLLDLKYLELNVEETFKLEVSVNG